MSQLATRVLESVFHVVEKNANQCCFIDGMPIYSMGCQVVGSLRLGTRLGSRRFENNHTLDTSNYIHNAPTCTCLNVTTTTSPPRNFKTLVETLQHNVQLGQWEMTVRSLII